MTNSVTHNDDIHRCPICDEPFKPDDNCATEITEGTCHYECLEGSAVVDLETGEELQDEDIQSFRYGDEYPSPSSALNLPIELDGIARQLCEEGGAWRSCSGCHELNEGVPTGAYSSIMKCHLGMGCHECGGIGAVWDTTDYAAMGEFMAADTPPPPHILVAGRDELNNIARALQDLWSVVKPEPRPGPFAAIWREYAAEIRRVVLQEAFGPNAPAPTELSVGDLVPRSELERLESLHRSEIADMSERFRSVNVEKAMEQLAKSLPPAPVELVVALQKATEALKPLADAVFNDNGDMTVSVPLLSAEECIQAYFAVKRIRAALSAPTGVAE